MLSNKRCLITGASRGIGQAIALVYAKEGASLLLTGRDQNQLDATAEKCKALGASACDTVVADLTKPSEVELLAKNALQKYGTVDVLVNNAGMIAKGATCLKGNSEEWTQMMQLNVLTPMTLMRLLKPKMVEQEDGVVINMGSIAGLEPMMWAASYAASKWALRGWSLSCYSELRDHNVKVCIINPGMVRTDFIADRMTNAIPERMIETEDVAEVALLPFKTSSKCVPCESTLRLTRYAM